MSRFKRKKSNGKNLILCFCVLFFLFFSQAASAQLFPELHKIHASFEENTPVYFVGNISLNGSFQGVSLNNSLDLFTEYGDIFQYSQYFDDLNSFVAWDQLYGFPVFSDTIVPNVNAYVVNTSVLSNLDLDSLEDLNDVKDQILSSYSNVSVKVSNGIALFGSNKQQYTAIKKQSYGLGGIVQLSFSDEFPSMNLGIISDGESVITTQTNSSLLYPFESDIEIVDNNKVRMRVSNPETIVLIQTVNEMKLYQRSILHFFPLLTNQSASATASLSIVEKKDSEIELSSLINNMNAELSTIPDSSITGVFSLNENLETIVPLISQVLNSGIILLNSSKPVTIDDTSFSNPSILVGRGPSMKVTINQQFALPVSINGNSSLLFVNNQLYTTNAASSDKGITSPLWSVVLWVGVFACILFYFLAKKYDVLNQELKGSLLFSKKWEKLLFNIALLIVCFFIVDFSVSFRFGLSFFTLIGMNVDIMITSLFFIGQLLILCIIFILYALPAQLIHNILSRSVIQHKYQQLTKILVALPFFWIGIQLYLLVLFNILLSFLPLPSIVPIG